MAITKFTKKKKRTWMKQNTYHVNNVSCQVKLCASSDYTQSWQDRMHDASTCISFELLGKYTTYFVSQGRQRIIFPTHQQLDS
jgi:hypothetical protein